MVEKDRDLMVVAEPAGGGEGAEADRVEFLHLGEVHDQAQWPGVTDGVDEGVPEADRGLRVEGAAQPDDKRAVGGGIDVDRFDGD
jgi:hypothetical protein